MGKKTPLYEAHLAAGAKIVDFFGWDMPLNYGSQIEEHHAVRNDVGMFDVSHMTVVDIHGPGAHDFLLYLLPNNIDKLKEPGEALYTCMMNEKAGIIDDLIVYRFTKDAYRLVVNCGTREKDLAWFRKKSHDYAVEIIERPEFALIAIQGPNAREKAMQVMTAKQAKAAATLDKPFSAIEVDGWYIARTGYTGEDGFEIMVPQEQATDFWNALMKNGVQPCGLGARDTLRLEAGFDLSGTDMDESVTPLESNLAWTIAWEPENRDFVGRAALAKQKAAGAKVRLAGIVLLDKGVLRNHLKVICDDKGEGEITSGAFSPTLQRGIALARIPKEVKKDEICKVEMRGKLLPAQVIRVPFVRGGKANFTEIESKEE
jgi:aminomethyltransferase